MPRRRAALAALAALLAAVARVARASQPGAAAPVAAPMRNLTWGQLNFLHTTDTHGWLSGHLQESVRPARRARRPFAPSR